MSNSKEKIISPSKSKTSSSSSAHLHAADVIADLDDVALHFGDRKVLDGVSFCVHAGECIALIGPNGAGKSSLLKVLLGLTPPTSGKVRLGVSVGYISQQSMSRQQAVPLSVREVVGLSGASQQTALESIQRVGMEDQLDQSFTRLSGGQQQRVLIAKAIASQPTLLILDEPTTGIDAPSQQEFYELIADLCKRGTAVIMVSHDIDAVLKAVDRVICLNQSVLYDGSAAHFEIDKYLPRVYSQQHKILHHRHEGEDHA